jgi:hypothetical protein
MIDILFNIGAAILGAAIGAGIGAAIAHYIEEAKDWFRSVWQTMKHALHGVGLLVRNGPKLFKLLVIKLKNGGVEKYYDEDDEGQEIDESELPSGVRSSLNEDGYVAVESFEDESELPSEVRAILNEDGYIGLESLE